MRAAKLVPIVLSFGNGPCLTPGYGNKLHLLQPQHFLITIFGNFLSVGIQ